MDKETGAGGAATNLLQDEQFNERVRVFQEFLDDDYGENQYRQKIMEMLQKKECRLVVNLNHIRSFNREYAQGLADQPIDYLPAFEKALKDSALALKGPEHKVDVQTQFNIGLEGSFGKNFIGPRDLNTNFLGKNICIEGIITKCSLLRPKVVRSVHYCEKTQVFHAREYRDGTNLTNAVPTGAIYPKEDEDGNPLVTEYGLCTYRAHQTVSLQEMPERAPAGQLPRPIDVFLDDDLGDKCKPGDRVQIVGVYRSIGKHAASGSALFKTFLLANNVKPLGMSSKTLITDKDIEEIKRIGKKENIVELLSRSIAPSIFGHDFIKKAVLLQLLGGMEKNLVNGTHIRGDINILLIGDPSTAKSQMLRFVLNIAPLAIATTGRGSSGVGLTAAVTSDQETGERRLEAGAMVLADRGIVCIDEFDKMSDIDRVAIHEVMEQQTVTIAKAGIHTSLNARCSVLAAANPVFGQYVAKIQPTKNINLPDSLLSRFDLLFIVLDNLEDEHNRAIGEHITRLHRFVPAGVDEGAPIPESFFNKSQNDDTENQNETSVFTKFNKLLHVGLKPIGESKKGKKSKKEANRVELISVSFLKKYLEYAKGTIKPTLTKEASDYICDKYAELRNREDGENNMHKVMPITARTLETLVRLSTAHAKARLSPLVEGKIDAEAAMDILTFALFAEVKPKEKKVKKQKVVAESDGESHESDDEEPIITPEILAVSDDLSKKMESLQTSDSSVSLQDTSQESNLSRGSVGDLISSQATQHNMTDEQRHEQLLEKLNIVKREFEMSGYSEDQQLDVSTVLEKVNSHLDSSHAFSEAELLTEIRSIDTLFFMEETNTIIFL